MSEHDWENDPHDPRHGIPLTQGPHMPEPPQWAKVIIIAIISVLALLCLAILVALLFGALDRSLGWAFG